MRVSELIDILRDYPPDHEVEMAIVSPTPPESDQIKIDLYSVEGVLERPHVGETEDDDDDYEVVWLLGGEDDDLDDFLDVLEIDEDDD